MSGHPVNVSIRLSIHPTNNLAIINYNISLYVQNLLSKLADVESLYCSPDSRPEKLVGLKVRREVPVNVLTID